MRMPPYSLKIWMLLVTSIIFSIFLVAQFAINYSFIHSQNNAFKEKTIDLITRNLDTLRFPLWTKDKEEVAKVVDKLIEIEEIFAIEVASDEGVLYRAEDPNVPIEQGVPLQKRVIEIKTVAKHSLDDFEEEETEVVLGRVTVVLNTVGQQQQLQDAFTRTLLFLLVLFVAMISLYCLALRPRKMVHSLNQIMDDVKKGQFKHDYPVGPISEFNDISIKLSELVAELEKKILSSAEAEKEAEKARDVAEKNDEFKSEFIQKISHEIRTPVHNMFNLHAVIMKKFNLSSDDELRGMLEVCRKSGNRLKLVVEDLLDFSRLEQDVGALHPIEFSLQSFFEDMWHIYSSDFNDKNISFSVEYKPSISNGFPRDVIADRAKLDRIAQNLIVNALKYTEQGSVVVRWGLEQKREKAHQLRMSIKDSGIGIEKAQLDKIFEQFYQCEKPEVRREDGWGLGLYYVRRTVEAMGGSITVDSSPGLGTIFEVIVPVEISQSIKNKEVEESEMSSFDYHGNRVFVVDDKKDSLFTFEKMMESAGIDVDTESCPEKALERLNKDKYGLIIIDYHMPGMNGITLASELRKGLNKDATLICLTADGFPDTQKLMAESEFEGVLIKPVTTEQVISKISQLENAKRYTRNCISDMFDN